MRHLLYTSVLAPPTVKQFLATPGLLIVIAPFSPSSPAENMTKASSVSYTYLKSRHESKIKLDNKLQSVKQNIIVTALGIDRVHFVCFSSYSYVITSEINQLTRLHPA